MHGRPVKRTCLIGLSLLALACKGTVVQGPGAADHTDPVIQVTSPERGTIAEGGTVVVSGTATDAESGVGEVTINGVTAELAADGKFRAVVVVPPGMTILETVATDRGMNHARDVRAVMGGDFVPVDQMIPKAMAGRIGPAAFVVLGQMLGKIANGIDIAAMIGNRRLASEGGGCLGVKVDLDSIEKSGITVTMTPKEGAIATHVEIDNLHVTLDADYDLACIGGHSRVHLRASKMKLDGDIGLVLEGDTMKVTLAGLSVDFDGFDVDAAGLPGAILELFEGTIEEKARDAIRDAIQGMLPGQATNLLAEFIANSYQVEILHKTATITLKPVELHIAADGVTLVLDSKILVTEGEGGTFPSSPSEPPAGLMAGMQSLGIGLADDLANQLMGGLWAAKALDQDMMLEADHPARIFVGLLPERLEVELLLPPTIDADEEGNLRLQIGDLLLRAIDDDGGLGELAEIAVSTKVKFGVSVTTDGRLALTTNDAQTWAQVVQQSPSMDPQLDASVVESLGDVLVTQLKLLADEALSALPIPLLGDALAADATSEAGGGYLVVHANLTAPP